MEQWPKNLDPRIDRITPYPCQTCGYPFASCKALATHKCDPRRSTRPARLERPDPKAENSGN